MLTSNQKSLKTVWALRLCKSISFPDGLREQIGNNAVSRGLSFNNPELTIDFYYPKNYGMLEMTYFHQRIVSDISPLLDGWYLVPDHKWFPRMPIKTSKVLLTQYIADDPHVDSLEGLEKEDFYIPKYRAYHIGTIEDIGIISMFSQNYSMGQENLFLNQKTLINFCENGFILQFSETDTFLNIKNNILSGKYGIHEEWSEGKSNSISSNCFNIKSLAGIKV